MGCLRFGLLGPLEVWRHGQRVAMGAPKQRAVLALLLLQADRSVTAEQLVWAVWDTEPPASAWRTVQSLISRLRRTLGCGHRDAVLIERQDLGYRMRVRPEQIDITRFERLMSDAGIAARRQRHDVAAGRLRKALRLWRGDALADIPRTTVIEAEAVRLEEQRHLALDRRVDADLRSGRHSEILGELRAVTVQWPTRERCWQHLMIALYRSGRRADALAAYNRARATLIAEVGVEPGYALQRLHRRILADDPSLAVPGSS